MVLTEQVVGKLRESYFRENENEDYKVTFSEDPQALIHILTAYKELIKVVEFNVPGRSRPKRERQERKERPSQQQVDKPR